MGRKQAKINMRTGKGSSTRGIDKGWNCRKTVLKVQHAKDTKMWKNNPSGFAEVTRIIRAMNR